MWVFFFFSFCCVFNEPFKFRDLCLWFLENFPCIIFSIISSLPCSLGPVSELIFYIVHPRFMIQFSLISSCPSLWEQHCDQNYVKCLNNLGKSQMLGGPEFPKPNICLYDSQIIQWLYCPPAWREIAQPKLGFFKNFYLLLCPLFRPWCLTFSLKIKYAMAYSF